MGRTIFVKEIKRPKKVTLEGVEVHIRQLSDFNFGVKRFEGNRIVHRTYNAPTSVENIIKIERECINGTH